MYRARRNATNIHPTPYPIGLDSIASCNERLNTEVSKRVLSKRLQKIVHKNNKK